MPTETLKQQVARLIVERDDALGRMTYAEDFADEQSIEKSRAYEQLHDAEARECAIIDERKWLKDLVDRLTGLEPGEVGAYPHN